MTASSPLTREGAALRKFALAFPEATEDMPWGHHAIKVKGKSLLFLSADAKEFSMSVKLPKVPVDILKMWIDESYRAIAPKKLVGQLPE